MGKGIGVICGVGVFCGRGRSLEGLGRDGGVWIVFVFCFFLIVGNYF